jgi:hypothetical protein
MKKLSDGSQALFSISSLLKARNSIDSSTRNEYRAVAPHRQVKVPGFRMFQEDCFVRLEGGTR